jgi:hypothetical protein
VTPGDVRLDSIAVAHGADRDILAADNGHDRGTTARHNRTGHGRQIRAAAGGTARGVIPGPLVAAPPTTKDDRLAFRAVQTDRRRHRTTDS